MISVAQSISTARLKLRRPHISDAPSVFDRYAQDREVTRYLTWEPHKSVRETESFLRDCENGWASGKEFTWAVTLEESGTLIGMVACRPRGYKADIGYVLARPYWNQGYMTEAAAAVVSRVLSVPEVCRVWAVCDVGNEASARVLEKLGMTREGVLRRWIVHPNISHEPRDCFVYSIVR